MGRGNCASVIGSNHVSIWLDACLSQPSGNNNLVPYLYLSVYLEQALRGQPGNLTATEATGQKEKRTALGARHYWILAV